MPKSVRRQCTPSSMSRDTDLTPSLPDAVPSPSKYPRRNPATIASGVHKRLAGTWITPERPLAPSCSSIPQMSTPDTSSTGHERVTRSGCLAEEASDDAAEMPNDVRLVPPECEH